MLDNLMKKYTDLPETLFRLVADGCAEIGKSVLIEEILDKLIEFK